MIDAGKFVQTLEGKPVAVFGLGISNLAVIKTLVKAGATVAAWDDNPERHAAAADEGAEIRNLTHENFAPYACLILAPGVPLDHPEPHDVVKKARAAGVEIFCDLEVLHRCDHGRRTIGITGTNGKSTTTALIGHILNECGVKAAIGGNIGKAALALSLPRKDGVLVLEISSFQLELCPRFSPDIAVLLNISPDHLDRHGSMEEYAAAKKRLFRGAGQAVIGIDDALSEKILESVREAGERTCYPIASTREVKQGGVYVKDGTLYDGMDQEPEKAFSLSISTLPGVHNHQNAAAAYAAARLIGIDGEAIYEAMKSFPGLPHRQFLVRIINGVAYVNDSKATNGDAAARALACYKNIYWVLGGKPKEGGLAGLEPFTDRIRHAFLIGEAADEFAKWLDNHGVPHTISGTLERATEDAHRTAQGDRGQPGGAGTVLLSPACASFDQFRNFEERGDLFTRLVETLPEQEEG